MKENPELISILEDWWSAKRYLLSSTQRHFFIIAIAINSSYYKKFLSAFKLGDNQKKFKKIIQDKIMLYESDDTPILSRAQKLEHQYAEVIAKNDYFNSLTQCNSVQSTLYFIRYKILYIKYFIFPLQPSALYCRPIREFFYSIMHRAAAGLCNTFLSLTNKYLSREPNIDSKFKEDANNYLPNSRAPDKYLFQNITQDDFNCTLAYCLDSLYSGSIQDNTLEQKDLNLFKEIRDNIIKNNISITFDKMKDRGRKILDEWNTWKYRVSGFLASHSLELTPSEAIATIKRNKRLFVTLEEHSNTYYLPSFKTSFLNMLLKNAERFLEILGVCKASNLLIFNTPTITRIIGIDVLCHHFTTPSKRVFQHNNGEKEAYTYTPLNSKDYFPPPSPTIT
jgi:hypothetical protein